MKLLSIRDLFVNYGELEILKGVSLEIEEGQIGVLLGANGSGKSTLLKVISGLHTAAAGSIWFQGKRIDTMYAPKIVGTGISHVPEGRKLFTTLTVKDNLRLGAFSRKDKAGIKKDLAALFERFPVLGRKQNDPSGSLSGGEQQLVAIGRALMAKPRMLLMDEPSQGLAPIVVGELADTIRGINAEGITIIIVEHNLRLGLSIAHQVFVLENGKIAYEGKASDLSNVEYAKKIYLGG